MINESRVGNNSLFGNDDFVGNEDGSSRINHLGIMALNFEYFPAVGNTVSAGTFIPDDNLVGIQVAELDPALPSTESKIFFALLNQIYNVIVDLSSPTGDGAPLGMTMSKANPVGAGADLINQNFAVSMSFLANQQAKTLDVIPLATTGSNTGLGKLNIQDVFGGASVKLNAGVATPGAGILIPSASIAAFGGVTHAELVVSAVADNRNWFSGLFSYMASNASRRSATIASAIILLNRGASSILTPPATFTDATNPLTGVLAADLPLRTFYTLSYAMTVQLLLNQNLQSFDVNHVVG